MTPTPLTTAAPRRPWPLPLPRVATPHPLAAQSANSAAPSGVAGTWLVLVTLRNWGTQAPLRPPFRSLVTFHRGGTLSESIAAPAFPVGQRTPGHGNWSHLGGSTYLQRVVALITFDTPATPFQPAFHAGWQTITHTLEQVNADQVTSSGTNTFYKADRGGRILVDTARNRYGATFAAPYAVRARPGAPVSAPCSWEEIENERVGPGTFALGGMADRIAAVGDLWGWHAQPETLPHPAHRRAPATRRQATVTIAIESRAWGPSSGPLSNGS